MQITESGSSPRPRVSVVMALNRTDPFLTLAIESILDQSYADFEFLIVVDRNSPGLLTTLTERYRYEPRIRTLSSPPLGGLAHALNVGIGEARGAYIARMDGDDISLPDRFRDQVNFLDEHPDVAVLGCRVELIGPDSKPLHGLYPYYETNEAIRKILPIRNPMPHPALMMRKDVLYSVGGYKFGHVSEDYELLLRVSREPRFRFHNLNAMLFKYRRHGNQATSSDYFRKRFPDMAGFLFSEFLRSHSPRYLLGMLAVHPLCRRVSHLCVSRFQ